MALRPRPAERAEPTIEPIAGAPGMAEAVALAATFREALNDVDRRLQIAAFERQFAATAPRSDSQRDARNVARLRELRAIAAPPAAPVPSGGPHLPPAIQLGLRVLAGEHAATDDPEARSQQVQADRAALDAALRAQSQIVDDLRADLSADLAQRLRPTHDRMLITVYRSAQALAAAMDAERSFRTEIILAGYDPRPDVLRIPYLPAAHALGSESTYDSQISVWRRLLQSLRIIE